MLNRLRTVFTYFLTLVFLLETSLVYAQDNSRAAARANAAQAQQNQDLINKVNARTGRGADQGAQKATALETSAKIGEYVTLLGSAYMGGNLMKNCTLVGPWGNTYAAGLFDDPTGEKDDPNANASDNPNGSFTKMFYVSPLSVKLFFLSSMTLLAGEVYSLIAYDEKANKVTKAFVDHDKGKKEGYDKQKDNMLKAAKLAEDASKVAHTKFIIQEAAVVGTLAAAVYATAEYLEQSKNVEDAKIWVKTVAQKLTLDRISVPDKAPYSKTAQSNSEDILDGKIAEKWKDWSKDQILSKLREVSDPTEGDQIHLNAYIEKLRLAANGEMEKYVMNRAGCYDMAHGVVGRLGGSASTRFTADDNISAALRLNSEPIGTVKSDVEALLRDPAWGGSDYSAFTTAKAMYGGANGLLNSSAKPPRSEPGDWATLESIYTVRKSSVFGDGAKTKCRTLCTEAEKAVTDCRSDFEGNALGFGIFGDNDGEEDRALLTCTGSKKNHETLTSWLEGAFSSVQSALEEDPAADSIERLMTLKMNLVQLEQQLNLEQKVAAIMGEAPNGTASGGRTNVLYMESGDRGKHYGACVKNYGQNAPMTPAYSSVQTGALKYQMICSTSYANKETTNKELADNEKKDRDARALAATQRKNQTTADNERTQAISEAEEERLQQSRRVLEGSSDRLDGLSESTAEARAYELKEQKRLLKLQNDAFQQEEIIWGERLNVSRAGKALGDKVASNIQAQNSLTTARSELAEVQQSEAEAIDAKTAADEAQITANDALVAKENEFSKAEESAAIAAEGVNTAADGALAGNEKAQEDQAAAFKADLEQKELTARSLAAARSAEAGLDQEYGEKQKLGATLLQRNPAAEGDTGTRDTAAPAVISQVDEIERKNEEALEQFDKVEVQRESSLSRPSAEQAKADESIAKASEKDKDLRDALAKQEEAERERANILGEVGEEGIEAKRANQEAATQASTLAKDKLEVASNRVTEKTTEVQAKERLVSRAQAEQEAQARLVAEAEGKLTEAEQKRTEILAEIEKQKEKVAVARARREAAERAELTEIDRVAQAQKDSVDAQRAQLADGRVPDGRSIIEEADRIEGEESGYNLEMNGATLPNVIGGPVRLEGIRANYESRKDEFEVDHKFYVKANSAHDVGIPARREGYRTSRRVGPPEPKPIRELTFEEVKALRNDPDEYRKLSYDERIELQNSYLYGPRGPDETWAQIKSNPSPTSMMGQLAEKKVAAQNASKVEVKVEEDGKIETRMVEASSLVDAANNRRTQANVDARLATSNENVQRSQKRLDEFSGRRETALRLRDNKVQAAQTASAATNKEQILANLLEKNPQLAQMNQKYQGKSLTQMEAELTAAERRIEQKKQASKNLNFGIYGLAKSNQHQEGLISTIKEEGERNRAANQELGTRVDELSGRVESLEGAVNRAAGLTSTAETGVDGPTGDAGITGPREARAPAARETEEIGIQEELASGADQLTSEKTELELRLEEEFGTTEISRPSESDNGVQTFTIKSGEDSYQLNRYPGKSRTNATLEFDGNEEQAIKKVTSILSEDRSVTDSASGMLTKGLSRSSDSKGNIDGSTTIEYMDRNGNVKVLEKIQILQDPTGKIRIQRTFEQFDDGVQSDVPSSYPDLTKHYPHIKGLDHGELMKFNLALLRGEVPNETMAYYKLGKNASIEEILTAVKESELKEKEPNFQRILNKLTGAILGAEAHAASSAGEIFGKIAAIIGGASSAISYGKLPWFASLTNTLSDAGSRMIWLYALAAVQQFVAIGTYSASQRLKANAAKYRKVANSLDQFGDEYEEAMALAKKRNFTAAVLATQTPFDQVFTRTEVLSQSSFDNSVLEDNLFCQRFDPQTRDFVTVPCSECTSTKPCAGYATAIGGAGQFVEAAPDLVVGQASSQMSVAGDSIANGDAKAFVNASKQVAQAKKAIRSVLKNQFDKINDRRVQSGQAPIDFDKKAELLSSKIRRGGSGKVASLSPANLGNKSLPTVSDLVEEEKEDFIEEYDDGFTSTGSGARIVTGGKDRRRRRNGRKLGSYDAESVQADYEEGLSKTYKYEKNDINKGKEKSIFKIIHIRYLKNYTNLLNEVGPQAKGKK